MRRFCFLFHLGVIVSLVAFAVVVLSFIPTKGAYALDEETATVLKKPTPKDYRRQSRQFRGLWVSVVSNIDFPSKPGLSPEQLMKETDEILDRAAAMRFNAIFLQVRPMGDALYPSELYPWSSFLTGEQGKAPDPFFDPLRYWIDAAHARGMELHAWINPYRVTIGKKELSDLPPANPAAQHPEWTFKHGDRIYLNPGVPEAREHVVKGLVEIVQNYNVDGVHIDDYFYPERNIEEDRQTFETYGEGFDNIEDWRRNNVNLFIRDVNRAVHKIRPKVMWSVSPAGIWANKGSHPLGSETRGNQCYFNLYADVRKWIKEETIDAVIPQIYWHIGFDVADFSTLVDWWSDVVSDVDVKLYVGIAVYRMDPNSKTEAWRDGKELERQLNYMATSPDVDGQVFFTANSFKEGKPARDAILNYGDKHKWMAPKARTR